MSFAKSGFELFKDYQNETYNQKKRRRKAQKKQQIWDTIGTAGSLLGMVAGQPWISAIAMAGSEIGKGVIDENLIEDSRKDKFNKDQWLDYKQMHGGYSDNLWNAAIGAGQGYFMANQYGDKMREILLGEAADNTWQVNINKIFGIRPDTSTFLSDKIKGLLNG